MMIPFLIVVLLDLSTFVTSCNPPGQNDTAHPILSIQTTTSAPPELSTISAAVDDGTTPLCHNSVNSSESTKETFQHIIVSGLPYERGFSHGMQAKAKIVNLIDFYKSSHIFPPWQESINFVRTNYLDSIQSIFPNSLEEMKGIAEGAGVQLDDILVLNSKYELLRWKESRERSLTSTTSVIKQKASKDLPRCQPRNNTLEKSGPENKESVSQSGKVNGAIGESTSAIVLSSATKYAHVLLGQNWNLNDFILLNDSAILLEARPDPCENIKPFVVITEAGTLGSCCGISAGGLGILSAGLWSSSDVFQKTLSQPWIPTVLLQRAFLESPDFSTGVTMLVRASLHVSINFIVATSDDESLSIELTPSGYFISQVPLKREILTHSNHFKAETFIAQNDQSDESRSVSSLFRDRRVARHLLNDWPRITEDTFQSGFKDRVGGESQSVCGHLTEGNANTTSHRIGTTTVASIIFNLSQRTLQISKGPPCVKNYKDYCFKFSQL